MRTRRLAKLTWPEVAEAVERGAGVVLPVGSTEQHAYHLPLDTDVALSEELALAVTEPLDLVVAPPVAYGYRSRPLSGGGQGFVGTLSVSGRTLMALVEDVLAELLRCGFKRIVLLNWHFENANFVYEAAWLAHERAQAADARIMVVEDAFAELSAPVMAELFGDEFPGWDKEHAAVLETSLMLHLRPENVLFDRAVDDESERHPSWDVIPTPADFVPASGALWKATRASAEKGASAWREITANLEAAIREELPPYSPMSSSQTLGVAGGERLERLDALGGVEDADLNAGLTQPVGGSPTITRRTIRNRRISPERYQHGESVVTIVVSR